jgi:hypothetical protein
MQKDDCRRMQKDAEGCRKATEDSRRMQKGYRRMQKDAEGYIQKDEPSVA